MLKFKPFITMDAFEEMSEEVKKIDVPILFYTVEDVQQYIEPDIRKSIPFAMKLSQQPAVTAMEKEARKYLLELLNKTIIFD